MLCGSNGAPDKWPPFLISATTETTSRTSISKPKKKPASLVDTPTPRSIITTDPPVSSTDQMTHGTFQPK